MSRRALRSGLQLTRHKRSDKAGYHQFGLGPHGAGAIRSSACQLSTRLLSKRPIAVGSPRSRTPGELERFFRLDAKVALETGADLARNRIAR